MGEKRSRTFLCISHLNEHAETVTLADSCVLIQNQEFCIEKGEEHHALWYCKRDGKATPAFAVVMPTFVEVYYLGYRYRFSVLEEREHRYFQILRSSQAKDQHLVTVRAPMPGLIKAVLVEEGIRVENGHPIAILEAMKMENEILAPKSGIVRSIKVRAGEAVEKNALLCVIEQKEHGE